jgi:adenylate kinase
LNNIFVEGIQGAGKSTLLNKLQKNMPAYKVYREGDISPVELAWCSYMTRQQFEDVCIQYRDICTDLKGHTVTEGGRKITAYTQILTDIQGFHKFMEQFEIYNGNVNFDQFKKVIFKSNGY